MAFYFPEGTRVYFSSTFDAADTITAITNASPAVASSAAHGNISGDELLIYSGWDDLNEIVVRAAGVTADTFQLSGVDTTNTSFYQAGASAGTARRITGWVEVPQAMEPSVEGGDAKFADIMLLRRTQDISVPIGFNPLRIGLTIAWDPVLPGLQTMINLSRTRRPVALKFELGGGAAILGFGNMSVREMPGMTRGQVMEVPASFSLNGRSMGYGAV